MHNLKTIALHRNAFELLQEYKKWNRASKVGINIQEIERFLSDLNTAHKKEYIKLLKHNPKQLEYAKGVLLHLTRILTYFRVFPSDENIRKFKIGALVNELESVNFLTSVLTETGGIESLLPKQGDKNTDYYIEMWIILTNVLECLNFKNTHPYKAKDMSIIKEHGLHDLCNICGFMESWKLKPMKTIRFLNKQLRNERMPYLPKAKKEIRI